MKQKKNVIILTHGWTGSSIFSALFGELGYWLGDKTKLKPDYDTFENAELVDLNDRLLQQLAPALDHQHRFADADVLAIEERARNIDLSACRQFVATCDAHGPWLWKDPRLTWTMRVWSKVLNLDDIAFLVLTRDPTQAWISSNLRRHVQSFAFTNQYNGGVTRANVEFLKERGIEHLQLSFEDLLLAPEATLARLNGHFGTELTLEHLTTVCRAPLHRKSRDWKDFIVAALIYLKNYAERDNRRPRNRQPANSFAK